MTTYCQTYGNHQLTYYPDSGQFAFDGHPLTPICDDSGVRLRILGQLSRATRIIKEMEGLHWRTRQTFLDGDIHNLKRDNLVFGVTVDKVLTPEQELRQLRQENRRLKRQLAAIQEVLGQPN